VPIPDVVLCPANPQQARNAASLSAAVQHPLENLPGIPPLNRAFPARNPNPINTIASYTAHQTP
jgi:hypothetical protein